MGYGERSLTNINEKYSANTPHAYSIPSAINPKKGVSFTSGRHVILCLSVGNRRPSLKRQIQQAIPQSS